MITAGLHVPTIPLVEVVGNAGRLAPIQTDVDKPKLKVGVNIGLTVTVNVAVVAQVPAVAVNVYVPLAVVLTTDALHVPLIPLVDIVGNNGTVPPEQILNVVPKLNVGVTLGVIVTLNVVVVAQDPAVGVKV